MYILGIESSCDETACAIVKDGTTVISSVVASQIDIHSKYGGVIPEIAAREHLINIDTVVNLALDQAKLSLDDIDAVAVTQGPGLIGALLVGISYAKALAVSRSLPLIPVNHVQAHVHASLLVDDDDKLQKPQEESELFPALAFVVSGGHTNLYRMNNYTSYELIAHSIDDACGECFDKVAKLLGLGYPGGKLIEELAQKGDPHRFSMPTVMSTKTMMFSYSGLKTHMVHLISSFNEEELKTNICDICASFQQAALNQLAKKILYTKTIYKDTKQVIIAGGVSANMKLKQILLDHGIRYLAPKLKYCGDNAAMIAGFGYRLFQENIKTPECFYDYSWDAFSRYDFSK